MPGQEKISNNYFDGLKVCGRHKAVFFIIMVAYFCEQMDNWNFGFIAPALMQHWGLTMKDIGTVTFWYFAAMTCGGFAGGFISDMIGRPKRGCKKFCVIGQSCYPDYRRIDDGRPQRYT
ncbi:MFS transporter, putative metabolite:H+ symporter, partial [Desulfovibrio desulfuricans]